MQSFETWQDGVEGSVEWSSVGKGEDETAYPNEDEVQHRLPTPGNQRRHESKRQCNCTGVPPQRCRISTKHLVEKFCRGETDLRLLPGRYNVVDATGETRLFHHCKPRQHPRRRQPEADAEDRQARQEKGEQAASGRERLSRE